MKMMKKFTVIVLVFTLFASMPLTAFAKGPVKKEVDYVALGDSLAAGVTPFRGLGEGYPDYLVERMEQSQYTVDDANFAFPGHNSDQLLSVLNRDDVQDEIKEAEYVTINIGANDLLKALNNPSEIQTTFVNLAANLQTTLQTIDELNPGADVYLMGYYNPFPYSSEEQQAALLPLLHQLNNLIENTAYNNGDTYVPTEKIIAKDYEAYLPNPSNIHLSEAGYQAVAKEFWKKLDKSKN
ncbi:lipase/acylhydrolase [Halobacillus andaensis]|uniref:Lipase/acylhydrolase n=1 Tax=Halobacillus andaensis TaxID=1176239 RepID=A0A917B4K5_HALAA|nr:GDSL-type esterase/lipase family protein [Halobacillus andaensis]MBP2004866.1 bacillolysin [Halobacillus andaensis]GGF18303.1 lipase/acylhydrolase [Halobacillus andaensis]